MGYNLRPVVETWGDSVSWSGSLDSHEQTCQLIQQLCLRIGVETTCHTYNDISVVYVEKGKEFLEFLKGRDWKPLPNQVECNREEGLDGIYDLSHEEIRLLNSMADMWAEWTGSIDPVDGSLRFYVD